MIYSWCNFLISCEKKFCNKKKPSRLNNMPCPISPYIDNSTIYKKNVSTTKTTHKEICVNLSDLITKNYKFDLMKLKINLTFYVQVF